MAETKNMVLKGRQRNYNEKGWHRNMSCLWTVSEFRIHCFKGRSRAV